MTKLHFQGHTVFCKEGETVLDTLVRSGLDISFSCKSGVCHRCMVKCSEGPLPRAAQRRLPQRLQDANYLLACQCVPTADLVLAPRSLDDRITSCVFMELKGQSEGNPIIAFDPCTEIEFHGGQTSRIVAASGQVEMDLTLLRRDEEKGWVLARLDLAGREPPAWMLDPDAAFGTEFEIRGPFPSEPEGELEPPPPDPSLWVALDNGKTMRAVLESFYRKVYADPLLSPFFERVTMERVIGKQYAFLMQCITGEAVYIGERPKNLHHWMVISDSLFDHRQALMLKTQQEHGMSCELIDRWSHYEEHFRPDIVKYAAWPRRIGDQVIETERYESLVLGEATVCDYCSDEIASGTTVRYHARLGHLGCAACAPAHA